MIAGFVRAGDGAERGSVVRPRETPPQFLQIWWEVTDSQGKPVAIEAMLCLRHRQEIASQFPSVRGTGQRGESCDLCQRRSLGHLPSSSYLGPRTSKADAARLSARGRAISPGLSAADGARGSCSRWAARRATGRME